MLISEIGIRGFKSFGNNEQVVKLNTEKGELILLVGNNGNGKSSFLSSFEYSLYGKVRGGRQKKWSTLSTLPNRINGELLNRIVFKSNGVDVEIKRGISPSKLELWENGILNERAGKSNIDDSIEKYVGMDIETFKSFISMNVESFKNFISLSNEEKQLLLDKLFNLEVINILNGILKDINKSNKTRMASLDSEIRTLDESIDSIKRSIEKAVEKEKENIQQEIDTLVHYNSSLKNSSLFFSHAHLLNDVMDGNLSLWNLNEYIEKLKNPDDFLKQIELQLESARWFQNIGFDQLKQIRIGRCPICIGSKIKKIKANTDATPVDVVLQERQYQNTDDAYEAIVASEESEIERTAQVFNVPIPDMKYAFIAGNMVVLSDDVWSKLENSDSYSVNSLEDAVKLAKKYGKDWKPTFDAVKSDKEIKCLEEKIDLLLKQQNKMTEQMNELHEKIKNEN
jgi:DNA repair exonuclease SbcCD ATPase subunit